MIIKAIKTIGLTIALVATFLVAASGVNAFAQDGRGRDRDRDDRQDNRRDRDDRKDNDRKDNHRDGDDRKDNDHDGDNWKDNHRDDDDWKDTRWERFDQRRGYRDGLIRGREDALEHRRFNPFAYPRFRFGSSDYREGFRSGYARAYRRFADDYRNRFGRGY